MKHVKPRLRPVPISHAKITGGFWARAQDTNAQSTLPIEYEQCKRTGRFDAFRLDWTPDGDKSKPHMFWDSDVAKWVEAAAYSLSHHPDPKLQAQVDAIIDLIASAQQPDGYLNVYFTVVEPEMRWANLRDWHELYNAGHLMEAGVAYYEVTGKRKLLDVVCRYADCIGSVFGPGPGQLHGYPGHEEIELALVRLYRATGEGRYLELARFFVDERGRQPHYYLQEEQRRGPESDWWNPSCDQFTYSQAHLPVREQSEIVGHAVRALYLYTGMADLAAETGDGSLIAALHRLWANLTSKRLYVTGGVGPDASNEGFTFDYDLPNETAHAETCAAIALVFFAHRLLNLEADGRYADIMERALYNGVLSGVSLQGDRFFYANPLSVYPRATPYLRGPYAGQRQPWFDCACCPPNICRLIGSLNRYIYSTGPTSLYVHLYAASQVSFAPEQGQTVTVIQETDYPWQGSVSLRIDTPTPQVFTLALRMPGWCRSGELHINGAPIEIQHMLDKGYVKLRRRWLSGDVVELALSIPVERVVSHPAVRMNAGHVALQRGPIVYCLEEEDNGTNLHNIALSWDTVLVAHYEPDQLGGVVLITGPATRLQEAGQGDLLYRRVSAAPQRIDVQFTAVPYFAWGNRRPGEMRVWLPCR